MIHLDLKPDLKTHRVVMAHNNAWHAVRQALLLAHAPFDPDYLQVNSADVNVETGEVTFNFKLEPPE